VRYRFARTEVFHRQSSPGNNGCAERNVIVGLEKNVPVSAPRRKRPVSGSSGRSYSLFNRSVTCSRRLWSTHVQGRLSASTPILTVFPEESPKTFEFLSPSLSSYDDSSFSSSLLAVDPGGRNLLNIHRRGVWTGGPRGESRLRSKGSISC